MPVLAFSQPDAHFHKVVLAAGVSHARQRVGLHERKRTSGPRDGGDPPQGERARAGSPVPVSQGALTASGRASGTGASERTARGPNTRPSRRQQRGLLPAHPTASSRDVAWKYNHRALPEQLRAVLAPQAGCVAASVATHGAARSVWRHASAAAAAAGGRAASRPAHASDVRLRVLAVTLCGSVLAAPDAARAAQVRAPRQQGRRAAGCFLQEAVPRV